MSTAKKFAVVALAVAVVGGFSLSANAQTTSDLQAQIAALLAQINALQMQLAAKGGTTGGTSYSFTKDLTLGSKGADVSALQQILINGGFLKISAPTGTFGPLTKAALKAWQASVGISPTSGYFGPKSRAYLASTITGGGTTGGGTTGGGTTGGGTTGGGTTGGGVVASSTGLAVALASDNPTPGTLLAGAGRVPVLAFTLTAGTAGTSSAATVNQIQFTKTGVVPDSGIAGAYLVQSGKVVAQYMSLNAGVITFSNLGFVIPAGTSQEYWLAVDVSSGLNAGNTVSFSLPDAAHINSVDSNGAAIIETGAFPINGSSFVVSTVSNPSLATLTISSSTVGTSVYAGTQNVLVSQWTANAGNSAVWLKSIKFKVVGSANKPDLQNVKLMINGTQVGSTISALPASGDAYFDLTSKSVKLNTGNSNMQVYADVMGSPSFNFQFELLNAYDVYAVDSQYNASLTVTVNGGSGVQVSIQQGQTTLTLSSDTPTGNIAKGQSAITLAKYKIYAAGEAVKIKFLDFKLVFTGTTTTLSSMVKNIALVDDAGGQVGTTVNTPPSSNTCSGSGGADVWVLAAGAYRDCFGTSASPINYIVPANTTRTLSLKADIQTGAGFTTVAATISNGDNGKSNIQGLTSSQTGDTGAGVTGSALSLASSALTVAQNSAVGTQTFTQNTAGARIGSYALTASSAEGVTISNVSIQTGATAGSNYQNLIVKVNGTAFGTPYSTLSATTTYTFSGTPFTVPAGQTQNVDVYADVLSGAATISGAATTLSSCSGTGVISNSSVSCSSQSGQAVTIGGNPSLTISADSGTAPVGQVVMGSTGNSLASFRFAETTNVEDTKITDMVVFQRVATSTASTKASFANLTLWNGSTAVGTSGSASASQNATTSPSGAGYNYAFHFATPVVVPKSGSLTLVLKGDVASFVSGGATDNATSTFLIGTSTEYAATSSIVTAYGNSSNNPATIILSSPNGNAETVLRSNITVATAANGSLSGRSKTTVDNLGSITFTASNGGPVALNTVILNIAGTAVSSTGFMTTSTATYDVKLYDPGLGAAAQGTATSTACSPTNSCIFTFNLGSGTSGYQLSAGASKTFYIYVDSFTHTWAAPSGVAATFAALATSTAGVGYTDAVDGTGASVNLPSTVVPFTINAVSYAQGT